MKHTIELDQVHNEEKSAIYWNSFYKQVKLHKGSSFCEYIKNTIDKNSIILDIGCGSGRDSFSFLKDGYEVIGIDRSEEAIKFNKSNKEKLKHNTNKVGFYTIDLSDAKALVNIIELLNQRSQITGKKLVIYLRFLLHSINESTEEILLKTLSQHLPSGTYLAAEFRTIEDEKRSKVHGGHYRRFIVAEDLLNNLEDKYNFSKVYFNKGIGLAKYKDEDPYIARIVMKKK